MRRFYSGPLTLRGMQTDLKYKRTPKFKINDQKINTFIVNVHYVFTSYYVYTF